MYDRQLRRFLGHARHDAWPRTSPKSLSNSVPSTAVGDWAIDGVIRWRRSLIGDKLPASASFCNPAP